MFRRAVHSLAGRFGYHVIRKPPLGHNLETHLASLLPMLGVNVVVDVGANNGGSGTMLREAGYGGRLVSFEPGPAFSALEAAAAADPLWWTYQTAIGDENIEAELNVTDSLYFSSLHDPAVLARTDFPDETTVVAKRRVTVRTLDSLFDEFAGGIAEPRIFLKSDTQGHDLAVVRGMHAHLDKVVGLLIEAPIRPLYRGAPDAATMLTELTAAGFRLFRSFPTVEHHLLDAYDQDWILLRS